MPKPPSLSGKARRSLSSFPDGLRPVRPGMNCSLMASCSTMRAAKGAVPLVMSRTPV